MARPKEQFRTQHLGLVVEPRVHRELKKAAEDQFTSLSSLCNGILKDWLKRKENDSRG